jgi:branched-chain amino acid transport system substrate-binding protein
MIKIVGRLRALPRLAAAAMLLCLAAVTAAPAADPIRIGFRVALTGAVAPNGKQVLLAIQVWKV